VTQSINEDSFPIKMSFPKIDDAQAFPSTKSDIFPKAPEGKQ
jgi:hypothetical protein